MSLQQQPATETPSLWQDHSSSELIPEPGPEFRQAIAREAEELKMLSWPRSLCSKLLLRLARRASETALALRRQHGFVRSWLSPELLLRKRSAPDG